MNQLIQLPLNQLRPIVVVVFESGTELTSCQTYHSASHPQTNHCHIHLHSRLSWHLHPPLVLSSLCQLDSYWLKSEDWHSASCCQYLTSMLPFGYALLVCTNCPGLHCCGTKLCSSYPRFGVCSFLLCHHFAPSSVSWSLSCCSCCHLCWGPVCFPLGKNCTDCSCSDLVGSIGRKFCLLPLSSGSCLISLYANLSFACCWHLLWMVCLGERCFVCCDAFVR